MARTLLIITLVISMGYLFVSAAQAKSCTDSYCFAQKAPVEYPTSSSGYGIEETDFC